MEVIKWSNGEKYLQSKKEENPKLQETQEKIWNELNMPPSAIYVERNKCRVIENKSEEILDRNMIRRGYQNPFFENKEYINVIIDQDKYLKPQNSNNCN